MARQQSLLEATDKHAGRGPSQLNLGENAPISSFSASGEDAGVAREQCPETDAKGIDVKL